MTTGAFRTRAPRQQVRMSLIFDRGDRYIAANLLDISESGMLLAGDEGAPVGKQVTLYADLNDNQSWPIHIDGLVVRHGQPAEEGSIAVRFLYASVAQLAQMRLFVQALREGAPPEVQAPAAVAQVDETPLPAALAEQAPAAQPVADAFKAAAETAEPKAETNVVEASSGASVAAASSETNAWRPAAGWTTLTVDPALRASFTPLEMADALGNLAPMDPRLPSPPPSSRETRDIIATTVPSGRTQRAARVTLDDVFGILDLDDRYGVGYVIDLSETGFFLATDEELEEGRELRFIPDGPDDSVLPLELTARVVRIQDMCIERPRGVACQFNVNAVARQSLRQFVATKLAMQRAS